MHHTRPTEFLHHVDGMQQPEWVCDSTEECGVVGLMAVKVGGVEGGYVDGVADGQVH